MTVPSVSEWREALRRWCDEFRTLLARGWSHHEAVTLFERIEGLAGLTELLADTAVAEATAEMAVYLCSFADTDRRPDSEQRARLERLVEDLRLSIGGDPARAARTHPAAHARRFLVYYLRAREHDQPGLAAALGQLRIGVLPLEDVDSTLLALAREQPDVVLMHGSFLKSLQTLSEGARRHSTGSWRRVLWMATGVGSDVHLRLYARRAGIDLLLDEPAADAAAATLLSTLLRRREQDYRILLVEDDRSHITFCTSLLRHQGFEVDVAESAAEAQALLVAHVPDLILLDINLPDRSGVELAQLLREQDSLSHVPIVFLTGEDDLDVRAEAIAAGGDDFLTKPVRPRHLIANVNSRVGRARALAMAAQAEPVEEGVSSRLDRMRLVESMERRRRDDSQRAALAVIAMDDVGPVAARLGFVRTGDLALQIALAIESEAGGLGQTCGIGEFSRLVLLEASSEHGLRQTAEDLRSRLEGRAWLSSSLPLRVRFSAAVVRFDGSLLEADAIIAEALALLDQSRREVPGRMGYRSLVADSDATDPLRRIARLMLSKPLPLTSARLQFRPMLPMRGSRSGQFLLRLALQPPGARLAARLLPDTYAEVAASMGAQTALDRVALKLARQYSRSALVAKHGWIAYLPVSDAVLQEPLFPDWLQREGLPASQLRIVIGAARLQPGSAVVGAIERIAQRGWRWVLRLDAPEQFDPAALSLPNLEALLVGWGGGDSAAWSPLLREALSQGKSLIVDGVDEVRQVSELFGLGAHYALGDAAGEWAEEPAFEAARPRDV